MRKVRVNGEPMQQYAAVATAWHKWSLSSDCAIPSGFDQLEPSYFTYSHAPFFMRMDVDPSYEEQRKESNRPLPPPEIVRFALAQILDGDEFNRDGKTILVCPCSVDRDDESVQSVCPAGFRGASRPAGCCVEHLVGLLLTLRKLE